MIDIVLEVTRAVVMAFIMGFLLWAGSRFELRRQKGWSLILTGFALVSFGSVLDITDNFEALNPLVVVGDTEVEAILEKVVGYLLGFIVLFMGFKSWIPLVGAYLEAQTKLERYNAELKELEETVAVRSTELEAANAAKLQAEKAGEQLSSERNDEVARIREAQAQLNQRRMELTAKAQELADTRYHTAIASQTRSVVFDRLHTEIHPRLREILDAAKTLIQGETPEPQRQGQLLRIHQSGEAILGVLNELSGLTKSMTGGTNRTPAAAE